MKKRDILKQFICLYGLVISGFFIPSSHAFNCLPEKCHFESVYSYTIINYYEEKPIDKQFALICDIKDDANEIRYTDLKKFVNENKCDNNDELKKLHTIIFRGMSSNDQAIFDMRLVNSFSNAIDYFRKSRWDLIYIGFWDVKGFDVNIFEETSL